MFEERPFRQSVPHRARAVVPTPGTIRPIYAGVFDLDVRDFDHAAGLVREWIRTHRTVGDLLQDVTTPFFSVNRLVDEGLVAEAAVSVDSRLIAVRLIHREGADRVRHLIGDPARQWRIEATVGRDDQTAWLAVRSWFTGFANDPRPCQPPRFVGELWNDSVLSDGVNFGKHVWPIEDIEAVELLARIIDDEQRNFPVVLIAENAPLDAEAFGSRGVGLAHVCYVHESERLSIAMRLGAHRHAHYVWGVGLQ